VRNVSKRCAKAKKTKNKFEVRFELEGSAERPLERAAVAVKVLTMAVQTLISVEEYLGTSYEHDPDYVNGEIVERGMPPYTHSAIQAILCGYFLPFRKTHNLFVAPEIRTRLSERLIRIPDVAVFKGKPNEVPTTPPVIAIEIGSPDDRLENTLEKFRDYSQWGVEHIWLVEPKLKDLFTYNGSLNRTDAFEISAYGIRIDAAEIFA
jgi:Uma2 family endonuclease